jgi:hypothetical protein
MKMITLKRKGGLLSALVISAFCLNTFASEDESSVYGEKRNEIETKWGQTTKEWKPKLPDRELHYIPPPSGKRSLPGKSSKPKQIMINMGDGHIWRGENGDEENKQRVARERAILERMDEGDRLWQKERPLQPRNPFVRTIGRGGWTMNKAGGEGSTPLNVPPQHSFKRTAVQVGDDASEDAEDSSSSGSW